MQAKLNHWSIKLTLTAIAMANIFSFEIIEHAYYFYFKANSISLIRYTSFLGITGYRF
jgi:hypothetical protein